MIKRILTFLILIPVFLSSCVFAQQERTIGVSRAAATARDKEYQEAQDERRKKIVSRRRLRKDRIREELKNNKKDAEKSVERARQQIRRKKDIRRDGAQVMEEGRRGRRARACERRRCVWKGACEKRCKRKCWYTGLSGRRRVESKKRKCARCGEHTVYRERRRRRRRGLEVEKREKVVVKTKKEKREIRNKARIERREKTRKQWQGKLEVKREVRKDKAKGWKVKRDERDTARKYDKDPGYEVKTSRLEKF